MKEEWKWIEEYEGSYQISNFGNVRSFKTKKPRILKGRDNSNGYLGVSLYNKDNDKKAKGHALHRLVAIYFIENPENKLEVNHMDGDKSNNCVTNLEWTTRLENVRHSIETGLFNQNGSKNSESKLNEETVLRVRSHFKNTVSIWIEDTSKKLNVSKATVYNIIKENGWKHILFDNNQETGYNKRDEDFKKNDL